MGSALSQARDQVEALLRSGLRGGAPIAADYPLVFGPDAPGRLVSVEEEVDGERQMRAGCATLVRELVTPSARLRVGFIGSVVVDKEHRRKGWGRDLLAKAEESLRAEGCVFGLLWAEDPEFYTRQGYTPIGTEDNYLVDPAISSVLPSLQGVREACEADLPALFSLYSARTSRVERSAEEMGVLLQIPRMEVLVREQKGEVLAYSCLGRGADFSSVVHEWAGEGEHVLALLQGHIQRRAELGDIDPLVMMVSAEDQGLRTFFEVFKILHARGILGLGKALDTQAMLDVVGSLAGDDVSLSTADGTEWIWASPSGSASMTATELMATLFESAGTRTAVERLESALGVPLRAFPLQPFVWGLDSI